MLHLWGFIVKQVMFDINGKVKVLVAQSYQTLCDPMDCSLPRFLCPWNFPGKILEWVAIFSGDLLNPGIEPGSHALQADYLPSESPGKPRYKWIRETLSSKFLSRRLYQLTLVTCTISILSLFLINIPICSRCQCSQWKKVCFSKLFAMRVSMLFSSGQWEAN